MKNAILFVILLSGLIACNSHSENIKLQSRIDSLEKKIGTTYKPGFGEFMSGIQVHHAKLWFAGINENWELADFEMHEIKENIDAIKDYHAERPESKSLSMLGPAMDSVSKAVEQKNLSLFKPSYVLLTNTCNDCHKAVNFSFNEVKIPDSPPFSNQSFKKKTE